MSAKVEVDRFGNPIDPSAGYARGSILASPEREVAKLGKAEPLALGYVKADPSRNDAVLLNRVSAAALAEAPSAMTVVED